jgi:hypothetical protein
MRNVVDKGAGDAGGNEGAKRVVGQNNVFGADRFYGIFRLVSKCDGGARKKTLIRRPKANKITRRNKLRLKWVLTPSLEYLR